VGIVGIVELGGSAPCPHYRRVPKALGMGMPRRRPIMAYRAYMGYAAAAFAGWVGACSMAQRLGGAPLLVARSIGSPRHSSDAWHWHGGTAALALW